MLDDRLEHHTEAAPVCIEVHHDDLMLSNEFVKVAVGEQVHLAADNGLRCGEWKKQRDLASNAQNKSEQTMVATATSARSDMRISLVNKPVS